jgi:hypothetical protein
MGAGILPVPPVRLGVLVAFFTTASCQFGATGLVFPFFKAMFWCLWQP